MQTHDHDAQQAKILKNDFFELPSPNAVFFVFSIWLISIMLAVYPPEQLTPMLQKPQEMFGSDVYVYLFQFLVMLHIFEGIVCIHSVAASGMHLLSVMVWTVSVLIFGVPSLLLALNASKAVQIRRDQQKRE